MLGSRSKGTVRARDRWLRPGSEKVVSKPVAKVEGTRPGNRGRPLGAQGMSTARVPRWRGARSWGIAGEGRREAVEPG